MAGIIRVGDGHTGGGVVSAGSATRFFMGRAIARLYDPVTCPKHGDNRIATATSGAFDDGIEVAQHNDQCECGCRLISSLPNSGPR
ncbi:PAAR domain-containing protein [Trinickia caryophylli]|uniref:PAAR domain-containing protein n=2 Tax=Trinickia caryophylli TaxID=28094 RepID=UPI000A14EE31|nr:PAAR domain-containing protein [Trinickia caryophylli]PMS13672.1 PAAR domain-containing protein [Trinickia caryophylli]TRX15365.1 PAAR domain-containing protein [Trinickia caryophylli]WQE15709.1 PAAR domain-containing protein [Trinickia caryophylli]